MSQKGVVYYTSTLIKADWLGEIISGKKRESVSQDLRYTFINCIATGN